jgi:hypothetical protein
MEPARVDDLAAELFRRAEERFGVERAEALRPDLFVMAAELAALHSFNLEFDDEP